MNAIDFATQVIKLARFHGYKIQTNRLGLEQIDFGNKKLHSDHLQRMFPLISSGIEVNKAIDQVAPGRPCCHRPMRELVAELSLDD
jgi:hypothetical protein